MAFQSAGSPNVGSMWIAELDAGAGSNRCRNLGSSSLFARCRRKRGARGSPWPLVWAATSWSRWASSGTIAAGGGPLSSASGTPSGAPAAWPMSVSAAATRMWRQKYAVMIPLRGSANASSSPGKIALNSARSSSERFGSDMLNHALATSWNVTVPRQWA